MTDTPLEPIRTGKVGRPAYPVLTPEDERKKRLHISRGLHPKKPHTKILSPAKKTALKKVLMAKGENIAEMTEAERNKKISVFVNEFIKNGGNASKAAQASFGITNKAMAANLGAKLIKEVKGIANFYLDTKGASYGKLIDTAVKKMEESKSPEWWDRLMKISGHEDFISKEKSTPVSVNIIGGQKDFLKGYIEEGEVLPDEN